jgi:hypothetical protein
MDFLHLRYILLMRNYYILAIRIDNELLVLRETGQKRLGLGKLIVNNLATIVVLLNLPIRNSTVKILLKHLGSLLYNNGRLSLLLLWDKVDRIRLRLLIYWNHYATLENSCFLTLVLKCNYLFNKKFHWWRIYELHFRSKSKLYIIVRKKLDNICKISC